MEKKERAERSLQDTLAELTKKLSELKSKTEEKVILQSEIKKLKSEIETLKTNIQTLTNQEGSLKWSVQELKRQQDQYTNLLEEIQSLEFGITTLQKDTVKFTEQLAQIKGETEVSTAELALINHHLGEAKWELDDVKKLTSNLSDQKRQADERYADGTRLINQSKEQLDRCEQLKREFIENPLSIGHYAGIIQSKLKKLGVDFDVLKEIQ